MNAEKYSGHMQPIINRLHEGCSGLDVLRRILDDIYEDVHGDNVDLLGVARLVDGMGFLLKTYQDQIRSSAGDLEDLNSRVPFYHRRGGEI